MTSCKDNGILELERNFFKGSEAPPGGSGTPGGTGEPPGGGSTNPAPPSCKDTDFRGTGAPTDPYVVCSPKLFNKIRDKNTVGVFYILDQDIDFGGAVIKPLGVGSCGMDDAFKASLLGNKKRIINYRVDITQTAPYYHADDRRQDLVGECFATTAVGLTADPRSPSGGIEGCKFFDPGTGGFGLRYGSATGPLVLCFLDQFESIDDNSTDLEEDYVLFGNLDLKDKEYAASPVNGAYGGAFDGNGNKIMNLTINSGDRFVGLFSQMLGSASIQNLKIENVNITSSRNDAQVGSLTGEARGSITNVSVTDTDNEKDITASGGGSIAGGLAGMAWGLHLRDSYVEGLSLDISGKIVGGLAGAGREGGRDGLIDRSYTSELTLNAQNSAGIATNAIIGGLLGNINKTRIVDSYAWKNTMTTPSRGHIGGLVGNLNRIYVNKDLTHGYNASGIDIANSYAVEGSIRISREAGSVGGLLGYARSAGGGNFEIENSFSTIHDITLVDPPGTNFAGAHVGGLVGASSPEGQILTLNDNYYIGEIYCGHGSGSGDRDICAGLVGRANGAAAIHTRRSYSTAKITQYANRNIYSDQIGLLFSSLGTRDHMISDTLYFIRGRIVIARGAPFESGDRRILDANQPCWAEVTPVGSGGCPNLFINDMDTNRSLTMAEMQTAPSDSTTNGNSPKKLGGEFLYTAGWCPRVCRNGVTCNETSLVGFDRDGNPLPGPGGGLNAQANNEGEKCFDVSMRQP